MQEPKLASVEPNFGGTGTSVVIKGEHLGDCVDDIISLLICGINCTSTVKWISSKCIKAMVVNNYKARSGLGEVIIVTNSGGKCLSSLTFELNITRVNMLEESDFWIDEAIETLLPAMDEKDSAPLDTFEPDPLGVITNDASNGAKTKAAINDAINQFGVTGSWSLFDENFSVNKFLITRHYSTSWNELKKGVVYLREILHIQQNKQESHSWLLNSSTVLVDMMNGLHALSKCSGSTHISPNDLHQKSVICYEVANNAFSCILRQQQEMEKLKHTIKLIDTYDYFFNLPSLFDKALHTKNYQSAMDNLEQVKTLLEPMPRKDAIMKFFHRYIELLKCDIWEELTECTSLSNLKHHQHPTSEYLNKYIDRCSPTQVVANEPSINTTTNATSVTGRSSITKKDQHQWKTYSEQLNHMFKQQKLIHYLNMLDPNSCHIWLYICQLEKNITTLISNSENVFVSFYVRKLKQIFNASENGFYSAANTNSNVGMSGNSYSFTNKQTFNAIFSSERRHSPANHTSDGAKSTQGASSNLNDDFFKSNPTDDDLISSHIDTMVMFVINYCDNFYNEICNFFCACHYYLEKNMTDSNFASNYNSSITMIVLSLENYFKVLSNVLFEIELGGGCVVKRNSIDSEDDRMIVGNNNRVDNSSIKIKRTLTASDSVDYDMTGSLEGFHLPNSPHPIKIVLISLLSYKQMETLATKIASIFKVFPSLVDSIRYKERKLRFNATLLRSVVNKKFGNLTNKLSSAMVAAKSSVGQGEKISPTDAPSLSTSLTEVAPISADSGINMNGHIAIARTFHDLMYELCQRMFLVYSQFTCDQLLIAYQNETWIVCDGGQRVTHGETTFNETVPCIRVDSNPFLVNSESSQLNQNPFLQKNKTTSHPSVSTTTQFPIDFHRVFIHWTLAVSFFLNPIISSKCLEDLDLNQLKCHDSNVRNIFMVYFNQHMETFKMVSNRKVVPSNFRKNNIVSNKNRDTIYLMIYCNVYYMMNQLLPLANSLFTIENPVLSGIIPQTVESSTLNDIYDAFYEFSNTLLNQYVKVKFRSVLLPIVVSFSSDEGFLYSIHSNTIQSHIYNFMIRLIHFTKDIATFKKSTHVEVMKRLCNSVAAIINDNVNKMTSVVKPYVVKQQLININALEVIFRGYIDHESDLLFKESIKKLITLDPNVDEHLINQTISQFTQQHTTLLKSLHF